MEGYSVEIKETSKQLTAKERVILKDTSNCVKLDEATKEDNVVITVDMYAVLNIHNEKSDNKEYENYIIIDKDGTKYVTGSESFWSTFINIVSEMEGAGEEYQIVCYRLPSKNYKGKEFLTCSVI